MFDRIPGNYFAVLALLLGLALGGMSCVSLQAPARMPEYRAAELEHASSHGVDLEVKAIEGRDDYWDLFDENLPRLGIAAVWVELRNTGEFGVALKDAEWIIVTPDGKKHDAMKIREVLERYYDARHIRLYSTRADREALQNLQRVAFPQGPVSPSAKRQGFLFFRINPEMSPEWCRNVTLLLRDVELGGGLKITVEVPLDHAEP